VEVSCDARGKNGKWAQRLRTCERQRFGDLGIEWKGNINVKETGCEGFAGLSLKRMLTFPKVKCCSLRVEWLMDLLLGLSPYVPDAPRP